MLYLLVFFTSLMVTIFFTPYLIKFLTRKGVVDAPSKRRVNEKIVPRMGGLIVFAVVIMELLSFYHNLNEIRIILIGAISIAACGMLDDIDGLKWYVKFGVQFFVAALVLLFFKDQINQIELFGLVLPPVLGYLIFFFFIVGVINSINLMDGLDGLVSGYALLIFFIITSLAFLTDSILLIVLTTALMGSLLGFLKFNAFPAQIFLGDTGSLLLGFFLAITSMITILEFKPGTMDLTFPVMLLAVPISDTLKVMFLRIINRKNPFLPDKNHLHHIIFGTHVRHKTTVFIIHFYTLLFSTLALYYITSFSYYTYVVFGILVGSLFFIRPILNFVKSIFDLRLYLERILNLHYYILKAYNRYLLWISAVAVFGILITTFPVSMTLDRQYISFMAIAGVSLFLLSSYNYKKTGAMSNVYVYLNLTFFFLVYNINGIEDYSKGFHTLISNAYIFYGSFLILTVIVLLFLVARERILPKSEIFLTGLDLTIIVFISLTFLLRNFVNTEYLTIFSTSLIMSFIFYMWYRVIITLRTRAFKPMYYSTFALQLVSVFYMIIFS